MQKLVKEQKGVTLIALVVTIVILIILVAVSMTMVLGNNGIFEQAKKGIQDYKKAEALEEVDLAWIEVSSDKVTGNLSKTAEETLQEILRKKDNNATVTRNGTNLEVFYKGYNVTLNDKENQIKELGIKDIQIIKYGNLFKACILDTDGKLRISEYSKKNPYENISELMISDIKNTKVIQNANNSKIIKMYPFETGSTMLIYVIDENNILYFVNPDETLTKLFNTETGIKNIYQRI